MGQAGVFSRLFGTEVLAADEPGVETPGGFRVSLRDGGGWDGRRVDQAGGGGI